MKSIFVVSMLVAPILACASVCVAQTVYLGNPSDAPVGVLGTPDAPQANTPAAPPVRQQTVPAQVPLQLTIKEAEALALKNNPAISVAKLGAFASHQVTREVRSNLWPTAQVNLTGVDANPGTRISAGQLNNPTLYQRAAAGTQVNQLITDFGRTSNLVASARLHEQAEGQNAAATKEQILLAVDQSFYDALQTAAVLKVAQQTVASRQLLSDQVSVLTKSKLKSDLDLSFANVNLAQAQLLQLDAENNNKAAMANLSAILGFNALQNFELVEDTTPVEAPAPSVDPLIAEAFDRRPEILAMQFESQSAQKYRNAQHDANYPTISALGVVGEAPVRNDNISSWYGAVGVNVQIPIFNGFLFSAKTHEADLRAQATNQQLADLKNKIARDVHNSWLNANTAYQRLDVSQQLLNQANLALGLAQTRYKLGLSSIVEMSQAQLQQTQAEIGNVTANYEYRLSLAELRYETTGI